MKMDNSYSQPHFTHFSIFADDLTSYSKEPPMITAFYSRKTFQKNCCLIFLLLACLWWWPAGTSHAADTDDGIIILSVAQTADSSALYTVNPVDGQFTKLFDFSHEPYDKKGKIFKPRVNADSNRIFFHSNNASAWVPADYNLFSITAQGTGKNQITPDSASGKWNPPGPYGTVTGKVVNGSTPIIGAPVYLEGMAMVATDANGAFRFNNVPAGVRYITAYQPSYSHYGFDSVNVVAGLTYGPVTLTPQTQLTGTKARYSDPIPFKDRIYYKFAVGGSYAQDIQYTDITGNSEIDVYHTDMDGCFAHVQGYDVGPLTGQLLIVNFATGCSTNQQYHNGIYTVDKDGNNLQYIYNMTGDGWDTLLTSSFKIFWDYNETHFAVQGEDASHKDRITIYTNSQGFWWKSGDVVADNTNQKLFLYGWSPDGKWILYAQDDGNASPMKLKKIKVKEDGSFDLTSDTTVVTTGGTFTGGTWSRELAASSSPWSIFTPVIINTTKK